MPWCFGYEHLPTSVPVQVAVLTAPGKQIWLPNGISCRAPHPREVTGCGHGQSKTCSTVTRIFDW